MPELPEVEALRKGLRPFLIGNKILNIDVFKPKLVSSMSNKRVEDYDKVKEFITELEGEVFMDVKRRAKNLIFYFESGKIMLVHLKMTGQMVYKDSQNKVLAGHPIKDSESTLPNKHSHIIFKLQKGDLFYNDTRMFGYCLFFSNDSVLSEHFRKLGMEPLDDAFTLEYLKSKLAKYKNCVKINLLNQQIVVGLGNIYADETLYEAGIDPRRACNSLTNDEIVKLHAAILNIIPKAIKEGGSSVANYLLADGTRGNYALYHKVYQKSGTKCQKCGTVLLKITVAQRSTVICTNCQK